MTLSLITRRDAPLHREFLEAATAPPPEAAPAGPAAPGRHAGAAEARSDAPVRSGRPRRLLTFGAVAGVLVVVAFAWLAVLAVRSAPVGTGSPPATTSPAAVGRLDDATTEVLSATTAAQDGFAAFTGIPTPSRVATVTDPYVDSLQLYETVLGGTPVGTSAQAADEAVSTLVAGDIAYFAGAANVSPANLGTYMEGFFTRATELQAATSQLEFALGPRPPTLSGG